MFDQEFYFDKPVFDDLMPDEKSCRELMILMLKEANGEFVSLKKYNERDMHRCARFLITKGFLRGTIFDHVKCSWSRITRRGIYYLENLIVKERENE